MKVESLNNVSGTCPPLEPIAINPDKEVKKETNEPHLTHQKIKQDQTSFTG